MWNEKRFLIAVLNGGGGSTHGSTSMMQPMDEVEGLAGGATGYNAANIKEPAAGATSKKPGGKNCRVVEIHPPRTTGDNLIRHFEMNLSESLQLLTKYQEVQERNKAVQNELETSKQATIEKLVQHLIQRKKDNEVVKKCVTVLERIKGQYENVKQAIAAQVKEEGKVLTEEKGIQCDLSLSVCNDIMGATSCNLGSPGTKEKASVEVTSIVVDVLQDKVNKMDLKGGDVPEERDDDISADSFDEMADGELSQHLFESSQISGSQRRKTARPRRHVRFLIDDDKGPTDSSDDADGSDHKRLGLSPTPVNLYANIIPKVTVSGRKPTRGTARHGLSLAQRPLPFSVKKRLRTECTMSSNALKQIYGETAVFAAKPSDKGIAESNSADVRGTADSGIGQSLKPRPKTYTDESLEVFSPMQVPKGFSVQFSSKRPQKQKGEEGNTCQKRVHQKPKRLDLSLNGKLLVQTKLKFPEIETNEDSGDEFKTTEGYPSKIHPAEINTVSSPQG